MKKIFEEARKMKSPIQPYDYEKILNQNNLNSTVQQNWSDFLPTINKLVLLSASVLLIGLYFYYQSGNFSGYLKGGDQPNPVVNHGIASVDSDTFVSGKSEQQTFDETAAKTDFLKQTGIQKLRIHNHFTGHDHDSLILNLGIMKFNAIDNPIKTVNKLSGFASVSKDSTSYHMVIPEKYIYKHDMETSEKHLQFIEEQEAKLYDHQKRIETLRNKKEIADFKAKIEEAGMKIETSRKRIEDFKRMVDEAEFIPENLPKPDMAVHSLLSPLRHEQIRPEPSEKTLHRLGINIYERNITFHGNIESAGGLFISACIDNTNYQLENVNGDYKVICGVSFEEHTENFTFYPVFVTEANGLMTHFRWKLDNEPIAKFKDEYFNNMLELLIPIHVVHPNTSAPRNEWIFWFMPDSAFAEIILEDSQILDIYTQSGHLIPRNWQTKAESAESTGENIKTSIQVYPNPVHDIFTIQTFTWEAVVVDIILYTLDGRKITELEKNVTVPAGKHKISFDKPDIPDGVYLLHLKSHDSGYSEFKRVLFGY